MRIIGWCTTFGFGLVCISSVIATGCSSSSTTDTGTGEDSGTTPPDEDAGDSATAAETSTPTPDGGTDEAGTCGVAPSTGTAACDTCLETSCCSALETCFGTSTTTTTACQMLVQCVQDAETGNDAAAPMTMAEAMDLCTPDSGSTYSSTDITNAAAFFSCLGDGNSSGACASSCAQ
jgi:hypothetical protein